MLQTESTVHEVSALIHQLCLGDETANDEDMNLGSSSDLGIIDKEVGGKGADDDDHDIEDYDDGEGGAVLRGVGGSARRTTRLHSLDGLPPVSERFVDVVSWRSKFVLQDDEIRKLKGEVETLQELKKVIVAEVVALRAANHELAKQNYKGT